MRRCAFGETSLRVSELGLGCARIGGVFQSNTKGFLDLLAFAYDSGINFFDTADMYSQGESEALLGRALRGKRDGIILASKAGYSLPTRRRLVARLKPLLRPAIQLLKIRRDRLPSGSRGTITQDFSAKYLTAAVDASLRRLRTDYLDLFQLHSPSLEVVERGEWIAALEELKRLGKIRYYGAAVDSIDVGLAALRYPGVSSVQFTLSLLEQRAAQELFPQVKQHGAGGIARECLANGLLVKPRSEIDLKQYCKSPEEEAHRATQLDELGRAAGSLTKRALAYPRSVDGVSVTLLGARNIEQLRSLLDCEASAAQH
jgi:aryl-alcohol dehydrogenase-like predicted oxidoreductase